jgi:surface polysaccharide O-acyltransferase-like enzyme
MGRMTAIIYFGEMLVASLLAIVLLAISPFRLSSDATLFAAGIVAWTLAEYVVHRFVLHGLLPTQHGLHHASPDAAVLTIFWQIWACFALIYLIAGSAFLAGGLVAYSWYLFVHHYAHHGPDGLPLLTA